MVNRASWERHPNIHGMAGMLLSVHDSFRAASATLVSRSGEMDGDALPHIRYLFGHLVRSLHHHHYAEEKLLFPLLEKRGVAPSRLLDDHLVLSRLLDEVEVALEGDDAADIARLARRLDDELREHLDREEATAVPVLLELSEAQAARLLQRSR